MLYSYRLLVGILIFATIICAVIWAVFPQFVITQGLGNLLAALIGGLLSASAAIYAGGLAMEHATTQMQEQFKAEREKMRENKLAALRNEIEENMLQLRRKIPNNELRPEDCGPLSDVAWENAKDLLIDFNSARQIRGAYISVRKFNLDLKTHFESVTAGRGGRPVDIGGTRTALEEGAKALGIQIWQQDK